ncbi:hypothetical protein DFJ43DRAFT_1094653 [Lentinula guzmanii]|uniref:Uncharacterized protein n=2 Tax=Lentinula TaxID=5352 RepID=A0AA38JJH8_9AGAR|nr:hypothetical protein DFJ43DRAFT_1094653 [Lentinula guzmanii]KAJ3745315.1 hypothetical protein DFH05DRAFT_1487428 [Lentinula detonsa]KAJ3989308.1 hypothetical protein F5890DRAFT_1401297 [Lentinula detonsa]
MFSAKTLCALLAAATVAAASPFRRQDSNSTTCYFIMTPTPDLGPDTLQTDINYAVGHTIGEEYPNHDLTDDNAPLVRHNDGTYDVTSVISVSGETPADVGAFVKTWESQTIDGIVAQWYVGAADCVE